MKKRTHLWGKMIGNNLSVSQSLTLDRENKIKHYIKS